MVLSPADIHEDRREHGSERLKQLQKTDDDKPRYEDIGTFTDTNERTHNKREIVLAVKVVKACRKKPPCKPMIWRQQEGSDTIQYEIHKCLCDKAKQIAAARTKQQKQQEEWIKKERRKKERLARENERWEKKRRERLRQVALQNRVERIRYRHIRSLQYGDRRYYHRDYRYRYGR
jgi:hypothetical protein